MLLMNFNLHTLNKIICLRLVLQKENFYLYHVVFCMWLGILGANVAVLFVKELTITH